ncbi:hypothetical protein ACA910_015195 [Epithemia clementina (nom. ined.)]
MLIYKNAPRQSTEDNTHGEETDATMVRFGLRRKYQQEFENSQDEEDGTMACEKERTFGVLNRLFSRQRKCVNEDDDGVQRRMSAASGNADVQQVEARDKLRSSFKRPSATFTTTDSEDDGSLKYDRRRRPEPLRKISSGEKNSRCSLSSIYTADDSMMTAAIQKLNVLRGRNMGKRCSAEDNSAPLAAADMMIPSVSSLVSSQWGGEDHLRNFPSELTLRSIFSRPDDEPSNNCSDAASDRSEEIDFRQEKTEKELPRPISSFFVNNHPTNEMSATSSLLSSDFGYDDDTEADVSLIPDVLIHHHPTPSVEMEQHQIIAGKRVSTENSYDADASGAGNTATSANDECTLGTASTKSSKVTLGMDDGEGGEEDYNYDDHGPQFINDICAPVSFHHQLQFLAGMVLQRSNMECGSFDKP